MPLVFVQDELPQGQGPSYAQGDALEALTYDWVQKTWVNAIKRPGVLRGQYSPYDGFKGTHLWDATREALPLLGKDCGFLLISWSDWPLEAALIWTDQAAFPEEKVPPNGLPYWMQEGFSVKDIDEALRKKAAQHA